MVLPTGHNLGQDAPFSGSLETMHISVPLFLIMLFGSTLAQADASPMSRYMDCARAMGVAINVKFTVIPGEQAGDKGLFVYTDRSAYFLPRGAPRIEDREAYEYFLKTNIAGVGDLFLVLRENKPGSRSTSPPAIGYQTTRPQRDWDSYRVAPAMDSNGDQARMALSQRLKEKIATVKDFIDDKNSFSSPDEAKAAFEKDRVLYRAKLETCRLVGDRELKFVVSEELQKLESGFPGTTIWEIQIGGRPPSGGASRKVSLAY
jgi:hypothetical protein